MPVISRFHGIIIKMYLRQREHNREKLIRMWETQEFEVLPPVE